MDFDAIIYADYSTIISGVNQAALGLFLILVGAVVTSMLRRTLEFRRAGKRLPILLKRGLILFSMLGFLSAETIILRVMAGEVLSEPNLFRLLFVIHFDVVFLLALGYYAKTELYDIDNPEKE